MRGKNTRRLTTRASCSLRRRRIVETSSGTASMAIAFVAAAVIGSLLVWGVVRLVRARSSVRESLEREGYTVLRMQRRIVRQGRFLWTTARSQVVYRVLVRDRSGRDRTVWARWGRTWLP